LVLALTAVAVPAAAQVEVTFEGYCWYTPAKDGVGSVMQVVGVSNPPVSAPSPMDMDYDVYEFTIWVDEMVVTQFQDVPADQKQITDFEGGVIRIYQQAKIGGTPADYADVGTFIDGDMILMADVRDGWHMELTDPMGMGFGGWGIGACDFVGGTRMDDLLEIAGPVYLANWTFSGTGIADGSFFNPIPNGYDRMFGIKLVYPDGPTPGENETWGAVKGLFR